MKTKKGAQRFFFAAAGYSYPATSNKAQKLKARHECARILAVNEYWAWDNGYTFVWRHDEGITSEDFSDEEPFYPLWWCAMYAAHPERSSRGAPIPVQSLGGVDFGRDVDPWGQDYRRVVEAELASQQVDEEVTA